MLGDGSTCDDGEARKTFLFNLIHICIIGNVYNEHYLIRNLNTKGFWKIKSNSCNLRSKEEGRQGERHLSCTSVQQVPAYMLRGAHRPAWVGFGRDQSSEPGLSGPELTMIQLRSCRSKRETTLGSWEALGKPLLAAPCQLKLKSEPGVMEPGKAKERFIREPEELISLMRLMRLTQTLSLQFHLQGRELGCPHF